MAVTASMDPLRDGGGFMGELLRAHDWSATALGPIAGWPLSLKTVVRVALQARQPMFIGWGPQLVSIYNDGYIPICGTKHPGGYGRPMRELWAEIWDALDPINQRVLAGESLWFEDQPFALAGRAEQGLSYFDFSYTPLCDDAGRIAGIFCVAQETTARVHLRDRQRREFERQRELFQQAPGFICTLRGPDHVFDYANDAYKRAFHRESLLGRTVREAFPEIEGQGFLELLDHVYRTGERHVARGVAVRLRSRPDGPAEERRLDFVYAPLHDETGRVRGIFCEGQDVTEAWRAQVALADKEEQLRLATDAGEIGMWDVDTVAGTMFWQPRIKAMFGVSPARDVTIEDFYAGLHPEDLEATGTAYAAACDPAQRVPYDVEYRTVGRDDGGIVRWVAAKGRAIFDDAGRCVRVIGTAMDISERKAAEAALADAERRKDEFIATLAHELRNPLAPLRNALFLLKLRGSDPATAANVQAVMERQVDHLVRLVDDLLEMSRISRGAFELRRQHVDLRSVIGNAVETCDATMRERRHALQVDLPPEPVCVDGDPVRLAQVFGNLLNNAARYTAPGGSISIALMKQGDRACVRVRDSGDGFTPADGARLFEMFMRGPHSTGLGIGLPLSRQLAQMHGGTLDAESGGPGHGATFTVRLPLAENDETQPAPPSEAPAMAHRHILVVDDNVDAAGTLDLLLRQLGADVRVAHSGPDALEAFERERPSLVLLDIGMPEMDGYEVARRMRAADPRHATRIVALSGWGQAKDRERGRTAGFDHHLVKPVDLHALQTLLAQR